MPVGLTVTLRGENMYNFLDKLIHVVLPRVRDFRGINKNWFDAEGNYNFGIKEHTIFLEVPQDDVVKTHGLQVTVKTTATTKEAGKRTPDSTWISVFKIILPLKKRYRWHEKLKSQKQTDWKND